MNLCKKFHPNRTMGKCSKLGEISKKKMQTTKIPFQTESLSFIQNRQWESVQNHGENWRWTDGRTDGLTDGLTNGLTDEVTHELTD